MKKIFALALIASVGATLTGCDDFLDDNRNPETSIINTPEYWSNPSNCQLQVDRYMTNSSTYLFPGYGTGNSYGWFFFKTLSDDQVGSNFADWAYPTETATVGEWDYSVVRGANYIISGVRQSTLSQAEHKNYEGIAKLIRAYKYYQLVRMFGDVVWQSEVVDPADEEILYGPRTNRDIVMDSVLQDLNYAIAAISTESNKLGWSQDLARAVKSEVCLYEGTFCRYRTQAENGIAPNEERAKKYLQECATVSKALLDKYGFCDDYHSLYNSTWDGDNTAGVTALSSNPEVIFGRKYDPTYGMHSTISYTASSTQTSGMSLDAFNAFLFLDGKPYATTSKDKTYVGTPDGTADVPGYSIANLLAVRDARLSVITDDHVYYTGMTWDRTGCTGMASSSGFGVAKFDNVNLPVKDRTNSAQNYTSCPIYWTSYIALNYAEAKAELGQFTDGDFAISLKKLYERAQLPINGVADLNAINDPDNNMGVSSLLWEIRRCRRCELMFDNWIRYWDLVRWHQLDLLDSTKHPNVLLGAYVGNAPVAINNVNGFVRPYNNERKFDKKYYLYPIPTGELDLNPNLGKNFGW